MPPDSGTIPPEVEPIDYVARWTAIVERRRVQMEAAYAAAGLERVDYWGRRAQAYRGATHARTHEDPFVPVVRQALSPATTLLDVGSGPGRHTLALAADAAHITAVDPSPAMLGLLKQDVTDLGLANVTAVEAEWMQADVEPADVVICSHVLYPIADVVPFIARLEAHARRRVFVYLRADVLRTDFGLWSEFYGEPLQTQPVHTDLFSVLAQMDIFADLQIVETPFTWTFETKEQAIEQVANSLCLGDGDTAARERLSRLLDERMERLPNGRIGPPQHATRSAIFSWSPRR
jgi:SAM-dependent methyltransferase